MNPHYLLRPKADLDLDEHAFYLSQRATPELGHRFLVAAHETFNFPLHQPAHRMAVAAAAS